MIAQIEIFFQVMNYCYIIFSDTKANTQIPFYSFVIL